MSGAQGLYESHPSVDESLESVDSPRSDDFPLVDIPSTHSGFRSLSPARSLTRERFLANMEHSHPGPSDSSGVWGSADIREHERFFHDHHHHHNNNRRGGASSTLASELTAARTPVRVLHRSQSPEKSRQPSPVKDEHQDEATMMTTMPAEVPLPGSPAKVSPAASREATPAVEESKEPSPAPSEDDGRKKDNYYKFSASFAVQQRTEAIETTVASIHSFLAWLRTSPSHFASFLGTLLVAWYVLRLLTQDPDYGPGPDLVKVAGLARNFEPIIYYSENGVQQVSDLQETGVAVWDLGESVRLSNMTSAPLIVKELDGLSDSLKTLAVELTRFFANVDGDIDSILIVMEWAKRELSQISSATPGSLGNVFENISLLAHKWAGPSAAQLLTSILGFTHHQVARATLQRTFTEFLNVLEESINNELAYSVSLFALFESIDRQFLNLQRTAIRETDSQEIERAEGEHALGQLWRWVINDKSRVRKFEKNLALLDNVKARTIQNKLVLVEHNGKLLQLKSNLEILRKRLVSPLVRSNGTSSLTVEEQIGGLEGTYLYLAQARERQKSRLMERLYGAGSRKEDSRFIDASL